MNTKTMGALVVTLALMAGGSPAVAAPVAGDDVAGLVKAVMDDTYSGGYDAKHACWTYRWKNDQGDETDYCMRPGTPHVVDGRNGKTLFLNTYSAADIRDDTNYAYTQNQPGLMGAFKVRLGGKQGWTYEALDAGTDYGAAGNCGCSKAQFVKLSDAGDYGWLFASGGTWQGVTVSNYSIVAPIKSRVKDLSKLPQSTEKAQSVTYDVSVKEDPSAKGFYPLHVVKKTAGTTSEAFDVPFDAAKGVYALPAGR